MARVLSAVVVAAMVVTAAAQLQGVSAQSPCKVHTWHNVTAMKGTWAATITYVACSAAPLVTCTQCPVRIPRVWQAAPLT